jgi:hypothetical protein
MGYGPSEFETFWVALAERGAGADLALHLPRNASDGRPYQYADRRGTVCPVPYSQGGPPIFVGGSVLASAPRGGLGGWPDYV